MNRHLATRSLLALNGLLALALLWNLPKTQVASHSEAQPLSARPIPAAARASHSNKPNVQASSRSDRLTPFNAVYSAKPSDFAANLRRVGCPEETVKDILFAEINRRYHHLEAQLKPKPADHVPWGWSPKTSEAKLLERRQQAASLAREKEGILRSALGYEVSVQMPLYAMTVSDRHFQEEVHSIPAQNRQAAHQAQEEYWARVEQLRSRTAGFWEPSDIEELNRLKHERELQLERLKTEQR